MTNWDDVEVNQISALLRHEGGLETDTLCISNLTGYSRHQAPLCVSHLESLLEIPIGEGVAVEVANESVFSLVTGENTEARVLVRFDFEELTVGEVAVPVYRTQGTTFRWPPDGGSAAVAVHFLGLWIPMDPVVFNSILSRATEPLHVTFPTDDFSLWFSWHERRRLVVVSSNEDLMQCLGGEDVDAASS